jgi:phage terminase large subunit GpA-like protein
LLKGTGSVSAPRQVISYPEHAIKGIKPQVVGTVPILMINTNKLKDELDAKLDRKISGGMIGFVNGLPKHLYTELTVERKNNKGKWENPNRLRNEAWDLLVYCIAILSSLGADQWDWSGKIPVWAIPIDDGNVLVLEEIEEQVVPVVRSTNVDVLKNLGELLA